MLSFGNSNLYISNMTNIVGATKRINRKSDIFNDKLKIVKSITTINRNIIENLVAEFNSFSSKGNLVSGYFLRYTVRIYLLNIIGIAIDVANIKNIEEILKYTIFFIQIISFQFLG